MSDDTGKHFDEGKEPISLIPEEAILGAAKVFDYGSKKYGAWNYRKGIEYTRIADSLSRHMLKFLKREDNDHESGLPHLYHAAANIAMLIYMYENLSETMDDRAPARKVKANATESKETPATSRSAPLFNRGK